MKKLGNLVAIVVLAAVSILFAFFCFEGFWQMINTRDNVWFFFKFFGAGFTALAAAGGASLFIDKLFKAVVNQDKWHNSLIYRLARATKIHLNKKVDASFVKVLNWK